MDIKTLIKDNTVVFSHYRQGVFYYNVTSSAPADIVNKPMELYQFPVPIEDIGEATLLADDKAITYMRWIRKAISDNTLIKIS